MCTRRKSKRGGCGLSNQPWVFLLIDLRLSVKNGCFLPPIKVKMGCGPFNQIWPRLTGFNSRLRVPIPIPIVPIGPYRFPIRVLSLSAEKNVHQAHTPACPTKCAPVRVCEPIPRRRQHRRWSEALLFPQRGPAHAARSGDGSRSHWHGSRRASRETRRIERLPGSAACSFLHVEWQKAGFFLERKEGEQRSIMEILEESGDDARACQGGSGAFSHLPGQQDNPRTEAR